MIPASDIEAAYLRIKDHVRKTPLEHSAWLSQVSASNVYIKAEHEQETNSFKLRGATNKIRKLTENIESKSKAPKRIITASSGNHGLACTKAVQGTNVDCLICVKEDTDPAKVKGLERLGAKIKKHGFDCVETENFARNLAEQSNVTYLSPYNDPDVIAGQGTIGVEILSQLPTTDVIFISVGGGGLISGVASYLKQKNSKIQIIGCQPENSAVMYHSVNAGKILEMDSLDTLSDGTAGGIENGAITFEICESSVDDWVLVTEEEISSAVFQMIREHCKIVEGAAGVAIAAFLKTKRKYVDKNVVILSCGANISVDKLKSILNDHSD